MRVAALYDIHGNLPALEAVLVELRAAAPDLVVVGGDVLPGPMPDACLRALEDLDLPLRYVRGNGESDVLAVHSGDREPRAPKEFHDGLQWVADRVAPDRLAGIEGWPDHERVEIEGIGSTLFCHATPRNDHEIFTRITPEERLLDVFESAEADVVICGHTHMPFERTIGSTRVVNAGSVGMPFGTSGAHWLWLGPEPEPRVTAYDLADAERSIAACGYPDAHTFALQTPPAAESMEARFELAAL